MELPSILYWLVPLLAAAFGLTYFFWLVGRRHAGRFESARALFHTQRQSLEKAFFQTASNTGKPRGLRWKACQWNDEIEWLRDKQTDQMMALVGVTISFEAIEGGDMEGIAAVGNLRNATAVFFVQGGAWQTSGRVVFNLNPGEAVAHFQAGYERVGG